MRYMHRLFWVALLSVACARNAETVPASSAAQSPLAGTNWVLVKFTGLSNADVIVPPAVRNYTVAFGTDGRAAVRADCDRGTGTWSTAEGSSVRLSQLARTTEGGCQPASIGYKFLSDLQKLNSWAITDGHLYISLRAKAGTYEFEPAS